MEKKALGKGLQALLPEKKTLVWKVEQESQMLALGQILPNRYQPRTVFSDEELAELAQSIKEHGVLQPVVVRRKGDGMYELIAGERRTRAAKIAGLSAIPAIIRNSNDEKALAIALIENIQRQNLNPLEEARAYSRLMSEFGLTQDLVAQSVGKERSTIANLLRLLTLPKDVQGHVQNGSLSLGHAKLLAGLSSEDQQIRLAKKTVEENLSVRQLEILIGEQKKPKTLKVKIERSGPYRNLEDQLRKRLGTKVQIKGGARGGQMIIHFFSNEELDRIVSVMLE
ncbi:MAG: ParB/RepB/Spo0J family partition protein [Nitrospira sp.]|nr:ParB/RepB/Spo0J family partition protein [Nitrospira sp.]MCA9474521.1 ParB/RepB/Spo0J family partition protein [Nitrospira sp.]MCA9480594.1 ParB/RepB/Spo0J family partition protein [Nitrospira sp.]MDR4488631.1 ParB/RepB/Spo0J family partition protein [Nitrospirales bacterium]HQU29172.1 ParB/RepB/Spo0J family partition protein [Nitrospirales bacterium]